jgi:hypothetical protein
LALGFSSVCPARSSLCVLFWKFAFFAFIRG